MATPKGGFDSDFVDPPPKSLECPICLLTLREPHVISCCGNHFCRPCIDRIQKDGKPCPICNEPNFSVFLHKGVMREINSLPVHCTQRELGCPWVGELGQLQQHVNPGVGPMVSGCGFVEVDCVYQCGGRFQRRLTQEHENEMCSKRPIELQLSGLMKKLEAVLDENQTLKQEISHIKKESEAKSEAVRVENQLLKQELARLREKQADIDAELQAVKAGNEVRYKAMKNQLEQIQSESTSHTNAAQQKEIKQLEENSSCTCAIPVPSFYFTFHNFTHAQKENLRLFSTPFYSHRGGYKLVIDLVPNGLASGKGSHVSLFIDILRGEYDDKLRWPFRGLVVLQMYNRQSHSWSYETTIKFDDAQDYSRPVDVPGIAGTGFEMFISHTNLQPYIPSDFPRLGLRVTKVVLSQ